MLCYIIIIKVILLNIIILCIYKSLSQHFVKCEKNKKKYFLFVFLIFRMYNLIIFCVVQAGNSSDNFYNKLIYLVIYLFIEKKNFFSCHVDFENKFHLFFPITLLYIYIFIGFTFEQISFFFFFALCDDLDTFICITLSNYIVYAYLLHIYAYIILLLISFFIVILNPIILLYSFV